MWDFPGGVHTCKGVYPRVRLQRVTRSLRRHPLGEDTPPPLLAGGPTDRMPQLSRQQGAIESAHQAILLLFYTSLDASHSIPDLRQCIPHQACVYTSLTEVKLAVNPLPDIPGLAGARGLSQDNMGKDEGLSEIHFRSSTPSHSTPRTAVNRRPTLSVGVEY